MKKILLLILSLIIVCSTFIGCAGDPLNETVYIREIYTWNGTGWQVVGTSLLYSGNETDPIFIASPASIITLVDINDWDDHPALTTGIHGVVGTIVGTSDGQILTNKTITAAVASGIWTNLGVWTIPAVTLGGDVTSDRWLNSSTNTFFGINAVGDDELIHTVGGTGYDNTGIGNDALYSNNTGFQNTAVGSQALQDNTEGYYNSAFGTSSLLMNEKGNFNTAIGEGALANNDDGSFNTAVGVQASNNNTSGSYNTAVGLSAGKLNNTGDRNVFIGYSAGENELGSDKLYIENSNTSTPLIYGDFAGNNVTINEDLTVKDTLTADHIILGGETLLIPAYGEIYLSTPFNMTCTDSGTYYICSNVTITDQMKGFSSNNLGRITYTDITANRVCLINVTLTVSASVPDVPTNVSVMLYKNGIADLPSVVMDALTIGDTIESLPLVSLITLLNTGDYLELYLTCDKDDVDLTVYTLAIIATNVD